MPDFTPPPGSSGGGDTTPAIEDNSGTPALADGITQAEMTTLLGVAPGATAYADADAIAAVEGEATLDLAGEVTLQNGKSITWPSGSFVLTNGDGTDLTVKAADDLILHSIDNMLFKTSGTYKMALLENGNLGIGTTAPANLLHLSDADASEPTILLENTGTSTSEPNLMFRRSGSHPSDPTIDIGRIGFEGDNSADENVLYAAIVGDAHVATDGSERGRMRFYVMRAGVITEILRIGGYEISINEGGGDVNFRVEGDTDSNLLFVDAGTDKVGIGTATPAEKLDVVGNIGVSGTVDGRDVATDGTKLDGIAASATAYADSDAISAVEGESDLDLAGDVTVASAKKFLARRLPVANLTGTPTITEANHAGRYLYGTVNATLPTPAEGVHYTFLNSGTGTITITAGTGHNINNSLSSVDIEGYNGATFIGISTTQWIALGV